KGVRGQRENGGAPSRIGSVHPRHVQDRALQQMADERRVLLRRPLQFAHGIGELRLVICHPRYKTQPYRMILAGDPCPYGHRCHFRHSLTARSNPPL
ncbi:hypothetical protein U1Q18_045826, partial [Sarracenia purpurea var. burkii]